MRWLKRIFFLILIISGVAMIGSLLARVPIGDRIAVVKVEGIILDPELVVKKIEACREDKSVKALVLRVDSPGGSVGASQEIYRALERFKVTGKPLVVSMGNVAASGGYYISVPADAIYANEGSITGSIGVIVQHIDYKNLLERLGVRTTAVKTGKFKDTLSPLRGLTLEEREYLKKTIEDAHEQFINAILKHRKAKVDEERLRSVADGRILTGRMAKELGLVDELGNLSDAIDRARQMAGVPEARVFYIEERKGLLRRLVEGQIIPEGFYAPIMLYYLMK